MKDPPYFSPAGRFSLWFWAGACATQDGEVGGTCDLYKNPQSGCILRVPLMAGKRLWSQRHLCWFVPLSLPCFLFTDCRLLKDSYFVSWSNTRIPHSKTTNVPSSQRVQIFSFHSLPRAICLPLKHPQTKETQWLLPEWKGRPQLLASPNSYLVSPAVEAPGQVATWW